MLLFLFYLIKIFHFTKNNVILPVLCPCPGPPMTAPPEMASLGRCCLFLPRSERPSVIIRVRKRSFNFWQMGVSERVFSPFLGRPSRCCPQFFFVPLFLFFSVWPQEKRGKNGRQLGGGETKNAAGKQKKTLAPKSIFLFPFSFHEKEKKTERKRWIL